MKDITKFTTQDHRQSKIELERLLGRKFGRNTGRKYMTGKDGITISAEDISGRRYGKLIAVKFIERKGTAYFWLFKCDCGVEKSIRKYSVLIGDTNSCGCLFRASKTKHGNCKSPKEMSITYKSWSVLRNRCLNSKDPAYYNYGGRGIKVCERWNSFENFLEDVGERPSKLYQIDRIDNNGNYEPGNCKWSTKKEQANNRRRSIIITYNGKSQSLIDWCKELNLKYSSILRRRRMDKDWKFEDEL